MSLRKFNLPAVWLPCKSTGVGGGWLRISLLGNRPRKRTWPQGLVGGRVIGRKSQFFGPTSFSSPHSLTLLPHSLRTTVLGDDARKEKLFPLRECHLSGHPRQLSTRDTHALQPTYGEGCFLDCGIMEAIEREKPGEQKNLLNFCESPRLGVGTHATAAGT